MTGRSALPTVGGLLRAAQHERGLSLRGLAAVLDVSPTYLSRVTRGQEAPRRAWVEHAATVLDADVDAWLQAAGHLPADLECLIRGWPNGYGDVRRLLGRRKARRV